MDIVGAILAIGAACAVGYYVYIKVGSAIRKFFSQFYG